MSLSTVAVTGGNGKLGQAILSHLSDHNYETVNVARGKRREDVSDRYVTTDLLDAGETYGALAESRADAVVHLGTIPGPGGHPQFKTFESNVMSAQHVLEASESLGLEACCIASSINAIGAEHQQRDVDLEYVPVDEAHPRTPDDIYGISKHAMEVTASGFGRRPHFDATISTLRYPWVLTDTEVRESLTESDRSMEALHSSDTRLGPNVLFSYVHLDDAATIARAAIEADFVGHESFWAVAEDTTAAEPTTDVIEEFFPEVNLREDIEGYESLFDVSKAKTVLDWAPERSWRTR